MYDSVCTKTSLIWKEHWQKKKRHSTLPKNHRYMSPARQSAGVRRWTCSKWCEYSKCSCSTLHTAMCTTFDCGSCADTRTLQHGPGHTPLHQLSSWISLSSPIYSKMRKCSSLSKSIINGGKCFMVFMASVWEYFLVEACSPLIIFISIAINNMHVWQLVKGISIHTAVFTTAQCKNVRILHNLLQHFFLYSLLQAVHVIITAELLKLDCNQWHLKWHYGHVWRLDKSHRSGDYQLKRSLNFLGCDSEWKDLWNPVYMNFFSFVGMWSSSPQFIHTFQTHSIYTLYINNTNTECPNRTLGF
jgi:hypothetical protein